MGFISYTSFFDDPINTGIIVCGKGYRTVIRDRSCDFDSAAILPPKGIDFGGCRLRQGVVDHARIGRVGFIICRCASMIKATAVDCSPGETQRCPWRNGSLNYIPASLGRKKLRVSRNIKMVIKNYDGLVGVLLG